MNIENLAKLCDWAAASAIAAGLDPVFSEHISAVIWRHAHGQGLKAGDDWAWILEQYGPESLRAIAAAAQAAELTENRSRKRRR
jgi:hypothetical protein